MNAIFAAVPHRVEISFPKSGLKWPKMVKYGPKLNKNLRTLGNGKMTRMAEKPKMTKKPEVAEKH